MSLKHFMIILPVHGLSPQEGQASILFLTPKTIQIRLHSVHKNLSTNLILEEKITLKKKQGQLIK